MQPEERLDALLSRGLGEGVGNETAEEKMNGTGELAPLLDAAERLMIRSDAEPSPTFASQLEADLLSRFAAVSDGAAATEHINGRAEAAIAEKKPVVSHASSTIQSDGRSASNSKPSFWCRRSTWHDSFPTSRECSNGI